MVLSASGPPSAAPTPISFEASLLPKAVATSVTTLSGSAVPNGGQDRAGGGLADLQLPADPLDAVHEQLAREVDDEGGAEQQDDGEDHDHALAGRLTR